MISVFTLFYSIAIAACPHNIIVKTDNTYDGDTIQNVIIQMDFGISVTRTVRLLGIDAPEMRGVSDSEKRRAIKSRDRLRDIVSNCRTLTLSGSSTDSFGRVLGNIYCDGKDVSKLLLEGGFAKEYK